MPVNLLHSSRFSSCIIPQFYKKLKIVLGFNPHNPIYYELALMHSSSSLYQKKGYALNNERLEFLGDRILDFIVADFLFENYTNENEGFLTEIKSKIVSRQALNKKAVDLNLHKLIICHKKVDVLKGDICGNALEALIGAIYLDRGFKKTKKFIEKTILKDVNLTEIAQMVINFKGKMISWAQKNHYDLIFETEINEDPNQHEGRFKSSLVCNNEVLGTGIANNKKDAEQKAAEKAYTKLFEM